MSTYSAADIVGNNLIAKQPVKLYKGYDFNNSFQTVPVGAIVGNVVSYLNSNASRPYLMWQFQTPGGLVYYAKHIPGELELEKFSGATSLEEQAAAEAAASQTTGDKIINTITKVGLGVGLFYLAATAIKSQTKK
jgi:hypothetical protein